MSDLSPDDLIKAWIFQDKIDDMAKGLLMAGIELGVKATTLTLAEQRLQGKLNVDDPDFYDRVGKLSYDKAAKTMEEKLNAKRQN
jgi:hypothetical protein